jgi:hypothetical protein
MADPPWNLPVAPPAEVVRRQDVPVFRELLEGHGVDTSSMTDSEIAAATTELVGLIALMHRIVQRQVHGRPNHEDGHRHR